jgi:CHAD domain-containing protein
MATNTIVKKIYVQHVKALEDELKKARRLKEKDIHKLRVEIKDLRAFFSFIGGLAGKKNLFGDLANMLTPVFKKAGKIRGTQINITLAQPYTQDAMQRFKEHLAEKKAKAEKRFLKTVKRFDKTSFLKITKRDAQILGHVSPNLKSASGAYLNSILLSVKKKLSGSVREETLHEIRKELKKIKSIVHLVHQAAPAIAFAGAFKKIETTYTRIGSWHDSVLFTIELENYVTKWENKAKRKTVELLMRQLQEKNSKAALSITKALKRELVLG